MDFPVPYAWEPCPFCLQGVPHTNGHDYAFLPPPSAYQLRMPLHMFCVRPGTQEHARISAIVQASSAGQILIRNILRIQNSETRRAFCARRDTLAMQASMPTFEACLFHTPRQDAMRSILREGIDPRLSEGGFLGRAAYFTDSAKAACRYWTGKETQCQLLLCNVLLGAPLVYQLDSGDSTLRREPAGFHSTTGTQDGANEFAVYRADHVDVQYSIHYTRTEAYRPRKERPVRELEDERWEGYINTEDMLALSRAVGCLNTICF